MEPITLENFENTYIDPIEQEEIDKFVCKEMDRQIHRYIKAMHGTKGAMERFIKRLDTMTLEEKKQAIARYIDLNRKVLDGLDFKIVLARAVANYCDTFSYMLTLINNKRKMVYYLHRIRDTYMQFHEVFEENGKFGIRDHQGNIIVKPVYDFLRTPYIYVDDLINVPIIAEKNGKMGLILADGNDTVVADFVFDDIFLRDEPPYFEAQKGKMKGTLDFNGQFEEM